VPLAIAIVALVGFETFFPLTIRYLIDDALIPHDQEKLFLAIAALVVLFTLAACARFVLAVIRGYMNAELNKDFRVVLVQMMKRLPMSYFDHAQPAHFSPLFDTELVTYSRMCRDFFTRGFHSVLQLVVIMITLALLNWQLALVVLVLLPLIVLPPQRRLQGTVDAIDRIRKTIERVNSAVQDYVSSQALIRAFGLGESAARRFVDDVIGRKGRRLTLASYADVKRTLKIPHFLMQTFRLSMDNQQALITLCVITAGACLSFVDALSLGTFSAFILFLPVVMRTITDLADFLQDLGRSTLSRDRFEQVREATVPPSELEGKACVSAPSRAIEFEKVSFSYVVDTPYMQDLDLALPIGESAALVGRSGAGKSTLFKLLLGFYRPSSGRVLIDGEDLRQLDPASLGAQIGTVLQGSILTNSTIRENIAFARPGASDEEVESAARAAEAHDFIMSLPDGYNSGVGEGGRWLSEGQKQRVALARAILINPAILLLDEVTASLDPESEAAITATVQRLAATRTVILVTHRLASCAFVDRVVVLDQGQVKEQGSHDELLEREGLYHQLWQMQTGFVVSADGHHAEVRGERLKVIPLFRDVDIETLDALSAQFHSEFFPAGQTIYEEGELGDKFYIVVRGIVSVSSLGAGDQVIRLADLQDGDYFGEVEMLNRGRRSTTVRAKTPSLVLALQADQFRTMMDQLSSLNKVMTQMALGRSLSTICSVGRRRRTHPILEELMKDV
jgi:ATP-binding cassette subfamily B protein